ncbi:hypothetical protein Tco_0982271 [Tanacetum coccineum]
MNSTNNFVDVFNNVFRSHKARDAKDALDYGFVDCTVIGLMCIKFWEVLCCLCNMKQRTMPEWVPCRVGIHNNRVERTDLSNRWIRDGLSIITGSLRTGVTRCQTVIDITVKHAFDNVRRVTSKPRNAIEKLWASVREQQTRRKQGKSVGNCGLLYERISPRVTNDGTNQGERATGTPNVPAAAGGVNSQIDGVNLITRGVDDSTRTENQELIYI